MATLAADVKRDFDASVDPWFEDYPVVASDIIYEGALVALDDSGRAAPGVVTNDFVGFCAKKADNSGGASGSEINAQVRTRGKVKLTVVGATGIVDVGKLVYFTDDNVFTLTATGGQLFGKVSRHISSTTCMVYFESDVLDINEAIKT
jgi:hypothetical protein